MKILLKVLYTKGCVFQGKISLFLRRLLSRILGGLLLWSSSLKGLKDKSPKKYSNAVLQGPKLRVSVL
jgi:hypothetical protein